MLLYVLQWVTLPKTAHLNRRFETVSEYISSLREIPWSGLDLGLATAFASVCVLLFIRECQNRCGTRFLAWATHNERRARILVLLGGLVAVRFYFSTGHLTWVADAAYHTLYTWITGEGMSHGVLPHWTPLVAAGTPFLQFYGFVFFYVEGLTYLLVDQIDVTLKVVLGGAHVLSGLTIYLFVCEITRSRRAGLVAAAVYVLSFWHTQQILIMGRYPVSLVYALLPVPFWAFTLARRRKNWGKHAFLGGGALALLILTHPGYGFWATTFYVLHIGFCWTLERARRTRILGSGASSICVALVLSSVLTLPMLFERDQTRLRTGFTLSDLPDPSLSQLLLWTNYQVRIGGSDFTADHWYGGYVGLSAVLLCLAGIGTQLCRGSRKTLSAQWSAISGLMVALVLMFGYRWPLIGDLPPVRALNAGRYELFLVFFLSLLAGMALRPLTDSLRWSRISLLGIALALIALDLGPPTFRQPYHDQSARKATGVSEDLFAELVSYTADDHQHTTFPPVRMVHPHTARNNILAQHTRIPTIACMFDEHTLAAERFLRPVIVLADLQVRQNAATLRGWIDSAQGDHLLDAIYLTGTRHLLVRIPGHRATVSIRPSTDSPIVISTTLTRKPLLPTDSPQSLMALVREMNVNRLTHTAEHIPVIGEPADIVTRLPLSLSIDGYEVYVDRVRLTAHVSTECFARLAFGHYPGLRILVNGAPSEAIPTSDGFVAVRLPSGTNTIEISGSLSFLRKSLWAGLGLFLSACLIWLVYTRTRRYRCRLSA